MLFQRRTVLRDDPVPCVTSRIPAPCFLRTSNPILSSAVSIGPRRSEEPPWSVRVRFELRSVQFPIAADTDGSSTIPGRAKNRIVDGALWPYVKENPAASAGLSGRGSSDCDDLRPV